MEQQQYKEENPFDERDESYELAASQHSFFDEVDSVKRGLVQYEDNIERIEGLQRRSLAESRADALEHLQRQVDSVQAENRGLSQDLRNRIKNLEAQSFHDASRFAQSDNLKRQFMTLIQKFQASEAAFRQRYRDVAARQYRIVDPEATDEQVREAIEEDPSGEVFSQALMQSNRRGEARAALTEVQQRHREIQKIETTMAELAQLFHDMEIMVAEQDQQVTNVETNVYAAQDDIERGVDNQFSAIKKARAWRKKKWICVIFLLVIVLVLALTLGIYYGTHN